MRLENDFAYSVLLKLKGKSCVVVGGGQVAARKLKTLCEEGAEAAAVAPFFCGELLAVAEKFSCKLIKDVYRKEYLQGAFVVIAATDDAAVNRDVASAAPFLCNNVTEPELGNFTVPASFKSGSITVALSTGGMPAFTVALKRYLHRRLGADYAAFNIFLLEERARVKKLLSAPSERTLFWRRVLTDEVMELLGNGGLDMAKGIVSGEIDKISDRTERKFI